MAEKDKQYGTYTSNPERRFVSRARHTEKGIDIDDELDNIHEEIKTAVSGVYSYKGSVSTYDELPTTDVEVGDVYNVADTGKNYAWNGTTWDDLGGSAKIVVSDVKTLTSTQIDNLQCGDRVIKQDNAGQHCYLVSYKQNETGICLTYTDADTIETVSYDYVGNGWVYNSTDITSMPTLKAKQDTLVSGENIKTINSNSLLGSGDISIPLVIANPTLVGTESVLNGLEVSGTKYKVGGGSKKYKHNILILTTWQQYKTILAFSVISNSNTKLNTRNAILDYLTYNYGLTSEYDNIQASGLYTDSTNVYNIIAICKASFSTYPELYMAKNDTSLTFSNISIDQVIMASTSYTKIYDRVEEI